MRALMPSRVRTHTLVTGELSVYCWCEETIVFVPPAVIQAGQTTTCGRRHCHPPEAP